MTFLMRGFRPLGLRLSPVGFISILRLTRVILQRKACLRKVASNPQVRDAGATLQSGRGGGPVSQGLVLLVALITATSGAEVPKKNSKVLFDLWASFTEPYPGPPLALGTYGAGCLVGGLKIERDGVGYAVMRPSRDHYYAHPSMSGYIHALSEELRRHKLPLLLVGDVS